MARTGSPCRLAVGRPWMASGVIRAPYRAQVPLWRYPACAAYEPPARAAGPAYRSGCVHPVRRYGAIMRTMARAIQPGTPAGSFRPQEKRKHSWWVGVLGRGMGCTVRMGGWCGTPLVLGFPAHPHRAIARLGRNYTAIGPDHGSVAKRAAAGGAEPCVGLAGSEPAYGCCPATGVRTGNQPVI
jgi:hypothetical protein